MLGKVVGGVVCVLEKIARFFGANPPVFRASLSQSTRLRTFFAASATFLDEGLARRSSSTIVSMTTVLASSNPSKVQPLNHRHSVRSLPSNEASSIFSTLDFPAPQSPCTPMVIGVSGVFPISFTTVLAIAS